MTDDIKKQAEKVDWKDSDQIIEFYEKNKLLFDNYKELDKDETIIDLINIKCHYIYSLINKSRFSKAKTFIEHVDILNQKIRHRSDSFIKFEEEKEYYLGLTYANLKNYSESVEIFKRLIKIDPDNDMYKSWYTKMKVSSVNKQSSIIGYFGLILLVIEMVGDTVFDYKMNSYLFILAAILFFGSIAFPHLYKYWIKLKFKWE